MNARRIRLIKEARLLFWPWCLVLAAGGSNLLPFPKSMVPLLWQVALLGFWLGIPLLATLSVGSEIQHHTLPLLLSQPIPRRSIWGEKWTALGIASASALVIYWLTWRAFFPDPSEYALIGVVLLISICSAIFWTLVTRSIIGGLILNIFQFALMLFPSLLTDWFVWNGAVSTPIHLPSGIGVAGIGYSLVMLWLGRTKLERFQATGDLGSNDVLQHMPTAVSRATAGWLRATPHGPLLNLLRKEIRFLWPVCLLTLAFLACLAPLRLMTHTNSSGPFSTVVVGFPWLVLMMASVLSGTLSMGEERTLGTHAWHMTLPPSIRRQWFTKLIAALLASAISTAAIAVAGGLLIGSGFETSLPGVFSSKPWLSPLIVVLIGSWTVCLTAFWCATAVKGTIRAALWVFPVVAAAAMTYEFGARLGLAGLGPGLGFIDSLMASFHPFPFASVTERALMKIVNPVLPMFPPLLIMLVQSYRLFRVEVRDDSNFSPLRRLLPLLVVLFVGSFLIFLPVTLVSTASRQAWSVLGETTKAVDKMQLDPATLDAAHPLQLTLDDVMKAYPMSDTARRWLNNTTIAVTPRAITQRGVRNGRVIVQKFDYFITVQLPNNWSCSAYGTDNVVYSCTSPGGRWGYPSFP